MNKSHSNAVLWTSSLKQLQVVADCYADHSKIPAESLLCHQEGCTYHYIQQQQKKNVPYCNVLLTSPVFILQNIILIWWKQWQHFDNRAFGCSFGVLRVIIWMHHKVLVNPSHNGERALKCRHTVLAKYLLFAGCALSCHHCCCCGCWR